MSKWIIRSDGTVTETYTVEAPDEETARLRWRDGDVDLVATDIYSGDILSVEEEVK